MASSQQQQQQAVEGIEKVYATLQPIRDLARNWDIDIAARCVLSLKACDNLSLKTCDHSAI